MGIKELFGKGERKAESGEKAKEAVGHGKLAPGKAAEPKLEAGETPHYFFLYGVEPTDANTLLKVKSKSDAAETVGELLSTLMR